LWGTINFTQKIGLRETLYFLKNPDDRINREIFDAKTILSTRFLKRYPSFVHIIEPSVEYEFVPAVDQSDIPTFDSIDFLSKKSDITFSFTNRTSGSALGGMEARLRLSNSYSLFDVEKPFSPVLIESNITSKNLRLSANAFYDVYDQSISETIASFTLKGEKGLVSIGKNFRRSTSLDQYSFRAGLNSPIEILGQSLPVDIMGNVLYDLKGGGVQELDILSRYISQCWGVGVSYKRRPFEYQIIFSVEFRGLGTLKIGKLEDVT
jgi:LPS-assembly protein